MEYTSFLGLFGISWLLGLFPFSSAQTVCNPGWFGPTCQYNCHCANGYCDRSTGHCFLSSCVKGWFDPSCQSKCYCTGDNCDLTSGACTGGSQCVSGWFGSHCQYQCHCADGSCNSQSGECSIGSKCANGWFGPACQYEDLAFTQSTSSTLVPLFDGDDTTCNDGQSSNTVTVALTEPFPFTWLRLNSKNPTTLQDIQVTFNGGTSCTHMKSAKVDNNTRDIHCELNYKVSKVNLEGGGVEDLCSVYISGGRNVALKQATEQSSILSSDKSGALSSNAVDGNRSSDWYQKSCTHTSGSESPYWSVILAPFQMLNRYEVYNRQDSNANSLQGFELTSYDENGVQVFHHKDGNINSKAIYSITTATNTSPISRVTVQGFQSDNNLTICEFEAYGDPICPVNKYGRECEHTCNCAVSGEQCFVSTGGCPSGCAAGYYGEDCNTPCPAGTFGSDCSQTCDQNCAGGECDPQSGRCTDCQPGLFGQSCNSQCNLNCGGDNSCDRDSGDCAHGCDFHYAPPTCKDCQTGWYGQSCNSQCNLNCGKDNSCDRDSGDCAHGCDFHYSPPKCIDCVVGWYGDSCDESCSKNCRGDGACVKESGTCTHGCKDDYVGPMCKTRCDRKTLDANCPTKCSEHCHATGISDQDSSCNPVTGVCLNGCKQGYAGALCDVSLDDGQATADDGMVTGLSVGLGLTFSILATLGSIYFCRRNHCCNDCSCNCCCC